MHPANQMELTVTGAMLTDTGRVRTMNEDTVAFVIPADGDAAADKGMLALVADGMGGHAAGEIASALAAEVVRRVYFALDASPPNALRSAFMAANTAILEHAEANPQCGGMGTTCTAVAIKNGKLFLAHVGDSRAYLLRESQAIQVSEDQSLHAQMVREGLMREEDLANHPGQNLILQALGAKDEIEPAIWPEGLALQDGDMLLLCSDGLSNMVSERQIADVARFENPQDACEHLIDLACEAGGPDNISVGIFRVSALSASLSDAQKPTRQISIIEDEAEDAIYSMTTRIIKVPMV